MQLSNSTVLDRQGYVLIQLSNSTILDRQGYVLMQLSNYSITNYVFISQSGMIMEIFCVSVTND